MVKTYKFKLKTSIQFQFISIQMNLIRKLFSLELSIENRNQTIFKIK